MKWLWVWVALVASYCHPVHALDCPEADDTACWQSALDGAQYVKHGKRMTAVEGSGWYQISDTLRIDGVTGGGVRGATFEWLGPPDRPMFLVTDSQQVAFRDVTVFASRPLESAFEFAKQARAPRLNVLDNVRVDGVALGLLRYGVRFSARYGRDEDNDQAVIIGSAFLNVTDAAISIEHTQSQAHQIIATHGSGAPGAKDSAYIRALLGGSFTSVGGTMLGFTGAVFDLGPVNGTDVIQDANSEGSARLLRMPDNVAGYPTPVHIRGGRFAVDGLAKDGNLIDFARIGPLTIEGLTVNGTPPAGVTPAIRVWPYVGLGTLKLGTIHSTVPLVIRRSQWVQ